MTDEPLELRSKVLLFDDETRRREDWSDRLSDLVSNGDLLLGSTATLGGAVKTLELRREAARKGLEPDLSEITLFDAARIVVVDYDLFELDRTLDGHHVSYLARCFSNAGLVVGVNQDDTDRWFDLTLTDHPFAFSDVSIGSEHLDTPALWSDKPVASDGGFRPWSWPHLDLAATELEVCVELVRAAGEDATVAELVGIDAGQWLLFDRELLIPITPRASDIRTIPKLRQLIGDTPLGKSFAKDAIPDELWARVVAARVRHWLESVVLPRQDALVDAPHLMVDLPGAGPTPEARRVASLLHTRSDQLDLPAALEPFAGVGYPWLSRQTWWRRMYMSARDVDHLREYEGERDDVFCEDTSSWYPAAECRRFRAGTGGSTAQRWVRVVEDAGTAVADYEPAGRLLT